MAISVGAPLYNEGNHEACFRIYEGAALELEKVKGCGGLKHALADGRRRAAETDDWADKAWRMRDVFDGIIRVARPKFESDR